MKTHCVHGHEYTPENTRMHNGRRECWTCVRSRDRGRHDADFWRDYRAKRKQADPTWGTIPREEWKERQYKSKPAHDRFWPQVAEPDENGCRRWLGGHTTKGYGSFYKSRTNGRNTFVMAHRFAYEDQVGQIPEGLQIDHIWQRCHWRDCCEPTHLEPVTPAENIRRAYEKGRANANV